MGIPLLDKVFSFGETVIDKIWMDKDEKAKLEFTKEELKLQFRTLGVSIAFKEFQLLLQDIQGAREVFIEELKAKDVPKWARAIQVLGRQYALYAIISLYLYTKVSPSIAAFFGKEIPTIELNQQDYWLIGTVFVFLFGARTLEKIKGKDKN